MFINITDSETGNNKGRCAALVNYLEKENRIKGNNNKPEDWFNGVNMSITPQEVRVKIDNNIAKLGRNDAKFYLINISPSQKEIRWLKEEFGELGDEENLKLFAVKVMDEYAKNFKRNGVGNNTDLLWYGKLEHYRYYKHNDLEVKQGIRKKGETKEGEQMHIQIIVSRKDITNKIKLSPMNNSRGMNTAHSSKLGQFDRKAFKQSGESLFDEMFGLERNLKEKMTYAVTMKNGSSERKQELYQLTSNDYNTHATNKIIQNNQNELQQILETSQIFLGELFNLLPTEDLVNYEKLNNFKYKKKRKKKF